MIKAIGGFGGVKLLIAVDEETYSVEFDRKRAYCGQAEIEPVGVIRRTANKKLVQKVIGYTLRFKGLFENVSLGDHSKINTLIEIIEYSQTMGIPITLWPKWNPDVPSPASYQVVCVGKWSNGDVNSKANIAQRIKDMEFESYGVEDGIPRFIEGRYIYALSTADGKIVLTNDGTTIEVPKRRDNG